MYLRYTQNKWLFCLLTVLLLGSTAKLQGQTVKNSEFMLGIGSIMLKDAERIPSGISRTGYFFQFKSFKEKRNRQFEFESRFTYIHPSNKYYKIGFEQHSSGFELNTGGMWNRKIPLHLFSAEYGVGVGESFNANIFFQKFDFNQGYYRYPVGKWVMSSDISGNFRKNLSQVTVIGQIKLPFLAFGRFDEYQNKPLVYNKEAIMDYLTPNSIVTINKYVDLKLNLSIMYCISSTKKINLTCGSEFNFIRSNVFNHLYLKQSNLFYVSILF